MLIEGNPAHIASFIQRKMDQWHRLTAGRGGVQMIQSGERGTSFSMATTLPSGYEGVIFGQLAHRDTVVTGSKLNPVRRERENDKKSLEKRGIDLSDDQMLAVLRAWDSGQSAGALDFVTHAYGPDGTAVKTL